MKKVIEDMKDGLGAMVMVDKNRKEEMEDQIWTYSEGKGLHKVMEYNKDTEMYKVHNGHKSQWVDWYTIDWDCDGRWMKQTEEARQKVKRAIGKKIESLLAPV